MWLTPSEAAGWRCMTSFAESSIHDTTHTSELLYSYWLRCWQLNYIYLYIVHKYNLIRTSIIIIIFICFHQWSKLYNTFVRLIVVNTQDVDEAPYCCTNSSVRFIRQSATRCHQNHIYSLSKRSSSFVVKEGSLYVISKEGNIMGKGRSGWTVKHACMHTREIHPN